MKFVIVALTNSTPVTEVSDRVVSWLTERNHEVFGTHFLLSLIDEKLQTKVKTYESLENAVSDCDFVVSIGGDGTILRAARLVMNSGKPILGINSGKLGFLANIPREFVDSALEATVSRNFEVDRRFMLKAVTSDAKEHYALNEFLFSKAGGSMITLTASFDNMLINRYLSDGIIVASPTGSTAYNMSSGGPIITPNTDVMVLNPINPHTLTTRPLVLPSNKTLIIQSESPKNEVLFSKDGEICEITGDKTEAIIRKSDFTIDLIKLPSQTYFDTLRNKLLWGRDVRDT